jgi:hypothetical protein
MQRSSESIGIIAAALAKQLEIANPEKTLTATIRSPFPREGDRSFRYASLATGLELVRKSLGRHEIATVQTTSIDEATGLIRLTTTLAILLANGYRQIGRSVRLEKPPHPTEWERHSPNARRYGRFALVGIAGDDDLDAPDLEFSGLPVDQPNGSGSGRNGHTATPNARTLVANENVLPSRSPFSPPANRHCRAIACSAN